MTVSSPDVIEIIVEDRQDSECRPLCRLNHMPDQPRQKPPPREGHGRED
jgi:hypothetical protein